MLGIDAALSGWDNGHVFGTIDYAHHISDTPVGELSAFAHGFGGATLKDGAWTPEMGITGGVELIW